MVDPERLHRLFRYVQFTRTVNRYGFVSVQKFFIYAEQGLSWQRVSIWIYEGNLQIEYQETLLAQYHQRQKRVAQRAKQLPLTGLEIAV